MSEQQPERFVPGPVAGALIKSTRARYVLGNRLGQGAMGAVFQARVLRWNPGYEHLPQDVAVKFITPDKHYSTEELMAREISAIIKLETDRVPAVLDWSFEPPYPYCVFQRYRHGSLEDLLKVSGPLEEPALLRLMGDVLTALVTAHQISILHQDIKPSNVLLDDAGGFVLADFGIAQAAWARAGEGGAIGLGTPGYQAPEQREKNLDQLDAQTDLWGLGATIWSAATGIIRSRETLTTPAGAKSLTYPMSRLRPDLRREICTLIDAMLSPAKAERPVSAAAVMASLAAIVRGIPLPTDTVTAMLRARTSAEERTSVVKAVMDPLWSAVLTKTPMAQCLVRLNPGEVLCHEGQPEFYAYILLRGVASIHQGGRLIRREFTEGAFLGEIGALTGTPRTATVAAETECWAIILNTTDFERFLAYNPPIAVLLLKTLAGRLVADRARTSAPIPESPGQ